MLDAWALDEGLVDLEGMVQLHLSTNFYPPFPHDWITAVTPAVIEAIRECSEGNHEQAIEWPTGIDPTPRGAWEDPAGYVWVTANTLVEVTKTWALVAE